MNQYYSPLSSRKITMCAHVHNVTYPGNSFNYQKESLIKTRIGGPYFACLANQGSVVFHPSWWVIESYKPKNFWALIGAVSHKKCRLATQQMLIQNTNIAAAAAADFHPQHCLFISRFTIVFKNILPVLTFHQASSFTSRIASLVS